GWHRWPACTDGAQKSGDRGRWDEHRETEEQMKTTRSRLYVRFLIATDSLVIAGLLPAVAGLSLTEVAVAAGQEKPKPRLSRPEDLSFFEQPDRDQWQKPDQIMDALKIADADQ